MFFRTIRIFVVYYNQFLNFFIPLVFDTKSKNRMFEIDFTTLGFEILIYYIRKIVVHRKCLNVILS